MAGIGKKTHAIGRLICLGGLIIFLLAHGALMNLPLADWSLLPELDDSLTYVLKTRQMQECWWQNCPALDDLRKQLAISASDTAAAADQLTLAHSRLFPIYHPLFSVILLSITKTGLGLMAAYQWLWRLSPLLFGLAFTYLLTKLTEPAAAGIALTLLAFKVFPDTGLHHLVPSNLTMAVAVVVWARIIAQQGWAPWTLCLSSLLLPAIHPVGVLYTFVSMGLALVMANPDNRKKVLLVIGFMVLAVGAIFGISSWVKGIALVRFTIIPPVPNPITHMISGALQNLQTVVVGIIRSEGGLFGAPSLFLAAVVLGLMTLTAEKRRLNLIIVVLNSLLLFSMLFYVSSHPGDVILRLWIPLVVILFGLVGQAFCSLGRLSRDYWRNQKTKKSHQFNLVNSLPIILLAVFAGYALKMMAAGGEQVYTYIDFLRKRQPLVFAPEQPELLLSRAHSGDLVFYNSLIIMPYFFIHGTMRLGAVYYHPALQERPIMQEWLNKPDLRYAVTYNPTVYHPSFAGVDEPSWWITSPNFRYSPLDKPRLFSPLAREGKIAAKSFHWLEIEVSNTLEIPKALKVRVNNQGGQSALTLEPLSGKGEMVRQRPFTAIIPAHWSGWLKLDLGLIGAPRRFRLLFPGGEPDYQISGLAFGEESHNWPWAQRAALTAQPREPGAPQITVSFDPRRLLPAPLNEKQISILDDSGSSVVLELH